MLKIKRIYDAIDVDDGQRILIDRLWPRGLSKEKARIDLWMKEIAPSNNLRKNWEGGRTFNCQLLIMKSLTSKKSFLPLD
jgi:uncharacterized protein YeaO (DUF488 family)